MISTNIERLQNAKAAIKQSIENKGVTVDNAATLDTYHEYIDSISTLSFQKMTQDDYNNLSEYDDNVIYGIE